MEDQVRFKLNKMILLLSAVFSGLFTVFAILQFALKQISTGRFLLDIGLYFLPVAVCVIIHRVKPEYEKLHYLMLAANLLLYFGVSTGSSGGTRLVLAYPIILMYFLYTDKVMNAVLLSGSSLISVYSFIKIIISDSQVKQQMMEVAGLHCIVLILFTATYLVVEHLVKEDIGLKLETIKQEKEVQDQLIEEIVNAYKVLKENCEKVDQVVEKVAGASGTMKTAVEQISEGATETAVSIQSQLEMTKNIQQHIEKTNDECEKMNRSVDNAGAHFEEADKIITDLSNKAAMTNEISNETQKVMKELKDKSSEIHQIVELITSIANQTNLLSLNAAIESARAGEAGKGFAVVAEEIRKLAAQSEEFAGGIGKIIDQLQKKADDTVESVARLSQVSREEGILIEKADQAFTQITEEMKTITQASQNVGRKMEEVIKANVGIVESINDISAVSQETTASSEEALSMSGQNEAYSHEAKSYVLKLMDAAEKMHHHLK